MGDSARSGPLVDMDVSDNSTARRSPNEKRRTFLKATAVVAVGAPVVTFIAGVAVPPVDTSKWPSYILRRLTDNVYLRLTAVGYHERRFLGARRLVPLHDEPNPRLVFTFPPQHFAETTIGTSGIPSVMPEGLLRRIHLQASEPSYLVLYDSARQEIRLKLEELLDWSRFETVLPDKSTDGIDLLTQPKYELAVDAQKSPLTTRIELPWGIELTPARTRDAAELQTKVRWDHPVAPQNSGSWTLLWTSALAPTKGATNQMEVLSVRGFARGQDTGSETLGNLHIPYRDKANTSSPPDAPLSNYDRITIAASLSRRFGYTGRPGPPPLQSAVIEYAGTCANACYVDGRTIPVEQFRLSALGGWLRLDVHWKPAPSCALTGWVQRTSLGRDEHVEVIDAGFLYPFGTPCELVVQSERVFVRDERGHYVAPLIKQVFLQIAEENMVPVDHAETAFVSLAITTTKTPPLDLPQTGNPSKYREYDFFMPTVKGQPFAFAHEGTDWSGDKHASTMPMIYISNKVTMANGLIWESGYSYDHSQRDAICGVDKAGAADQMHTIPTTGDGLKVVDKIWNQTDYRFAKYQKSLVALARPISKGDTSHRVDWIEWTRAGIPDMSPKAAVARPFGPRARTLRLRLEGMGQMSGQDSSVLATYRDVRSVAFPILEPDPTAIPSLYGINVQPGTSLQDSPFLYLLETRALIAEAAGGIPLTEAERAAQIRQSYYNVNAGGISDSLFFNISNEIQFGRDGTAEGVGGLSVPDTHVSTLTRNNGPVGDATFNERRWPGYGPKKDDLESVGRVDFAAYRQAKRKYIDQQPFDNFRVQSDLTAIEHEAREVMGFAAKPVVARLSNSSNFYPGLPSANLALGDLFGADAQILPGLSFADIFKNVLFGDSQRLSTRMALDGDNRVAPPLAWKVKMMGLEPIMNIVGDKPGQPTLAQLLAAMAADAKKIVDPEPYAIGMEASLVWQNEVFKSETIGPLKFEPIEGRTKMSIDARSNIDLGTVSVSSNLQKLDFQPGKASVTANARFENFSITLFDAIKVTFAAVSFDMRSDGSKDFKTEISSVDLVGPLAFISQLSDVLGGLGGDEGLKVDLSPERAKISQLLRFPTTEGQPLFIGPAQVINLALGWSVMIPLRGRDVLSVGFAVSSREKPLVIYVPPFYGGKAHVLIEITTKGCRLIEVSMEYGALVPVTWPLTTGIANITAGIFYMCQKVLDGAGNLSSGKVVLRAFVKAAVDLKVAGFIDFCGLIYIALESVESEGNKVIRGEATVTVSVKIGFVRASYSFTAPHEERSAGSSQLRAQDQHRIAPIVAKHSFADFQGEVLYSQMTHDRRAALRRIVGGYTS